MDEEIVETRVKTSFSARLEVELVFDHSISVDDARERYILGDVEADMVVSEVVTGVGP